MYRIFLLSGVLLAAPSMLKAAAPPSSDHEATTELEAVLIEASAGTPWEYFSLPGFEVLSHCPHNFNVAYVRALEKATAARFALLPAAFWGDLPTPMKIVLYDSKPVPRESFQAGDPIDLAWRREIDATVGPEAIQLTHPIVVGDGDTFINCGNYWNIHSREDLSVDPDSGIRLKARVPQFPAWFIAGLEGPFGLYINHLIKSTAAGDSLILPNAIWLSPEATVILQQAGKGKHKGASRVPVSAILPLERLLSGPALLDQDLWNSEAALFIRWALYSREKDGQNHRQDLLEVVNRSTREPITESIFKTCFGLSYKEVEQRLIDYIPTAVSNFVELPVVATSGQPWNNREASASDVARIIGDWGRLQGRQLRMQNLEYQQQCRERAKKLFDREYAKNNKDPLFLAAFGLYAAESGDPRRADEALETATRAGVARPRAYVELARVRLDQALPYIQHGVGDLNQTEYSEIVKLLRTARSQMPGLVSTYHVLVRTFEHAPERPTLEDLRMLREAVELFPHDSVLIYQVAKIYQGYGHFDEAARLVEWGMGFAETDKARLQLSRLSGSR